MHSVFSHTANYQVDFTGSSTSYIFFTQHQSLYEQSLLLCWSSLVHLSWTVYVAKMLILSHMKDDFEVAGDFFTRRNKEKNV